MSSKKQDAELQEENQEQEQESKKETLTQKQIIDWKKKYGKIFKTKVGDHVCIWRKLKRKEYVKIMADESGETESERIYKRQEEIAKTVVIYPDNFSELMEDNAGIASTIADEALARSGFDITTTEEL